MTEQIAAGQLDFEALRRASEQREAETLLGLYADDAEVRIVNKNCPPSMSSLLRGKGAISDYIRDVCSREMTHRIENEVISENRVAYNEACEYPDGTRVLSAMTLEVRDGKIIRQLSVEAWDE